MFTSADDPPPESTFTETFADPSLVTLSDPSSGVIEVDFSAIGAGSDAGFGVRLSAIPEPSSALLAGLALVGGLVRRRR